MANRECSWVSHAGTHVNLATATRIEEIGPQGTAGYVIRHGVVETTIALEHPDGRARAAAEIAAIKQLLTRIRFWLYDRQLPNVAGGSRDDDPRC